MILMMNRSNKDHEQVRESVGRTDAEEYADTTKGPLQKDFLTLEFQPGEWDVICHSGKDPKSHVGNRRFKVLVQNYLSSYVKAESRILKSAVITDIISVIRSKSTQNGGFVRYDDKERRWYEVGDKVARDKVGHSLREAMRAVGESSSSSVLLESAAAAAPARVASAGSSVKAAAPSPSSASVSSATIMNSLISPSIIPEKAQSAAATNTDNKSSSGSSNLGTISGEVHSDHEEELTPVAMNLADWFEADSMDET